MSVESTKTIRTAIQTFISWLPTLPLLVPALGLSTTAGVGAGVIAVVATITRVMQIPQVDEFLRKYFKVPSVIQK